jgi:hypothetical protein
VIFWIILTLNNKIINNKKNNLRFNNSYNKCNNKTHNNRQKNKNLILINKKFKMFRII